ncbi:hypothetical protein EDC01DRAFT_706478 [Geopyxis carbonaria]|nr:hypothetical protein EDC01DRAFT_706478 [Geopyxis carbonaria]
MASTAPLYPLAPASELRSRYLNAPISSLPVPSALLHLATVQNNCIRLLNACTRLGCSFRPHIKTHKTAELTRLQIGDGSVTCGRVVVSTVREAEALEECGLIREGVVKDILYGLPCAPSAAPRLAALRDRNLGLTISIMLDHASQIPALTSAGGSWSAYIKLDGSYHRAGLPPSSSELTTLAAAIAAAPGVTLVGVYAHAGNSYAADSADVATTYLSEELHLVTDAARRLGRGKQELVLSVGATPTALSAAASAELQMLVAAGWRIEVHAGVYTVLDLQQLATQPDGIGRRDLALTMLAEVASVYPARGVGQVDEALVGLGTTGLGREPGREEGVWGVVVGEDGEESGWVVGRISQEHGVLVNRGRGRELVVGEKVRVWPQHACIASAGHGWYFVTDGKRVVDVWVRWRGW